MDIFKNEENLGMVFKNDCGKSDSVFKNTENLNVVFKNGNLLQVVFKNMENLLNSSALICCLAMIGGKISRKNTNLKTKLLESQGGRIDDCDLKNCSLEKLTEKSIIIEAKKRKSKIFEKSIDSGKIKRYYKYITREHHKKFLGGFNHE